MYRDVNGIAAMPAGLPIKPVQCRGGRNMIRLSQRALAEAVGVSERTVYGFERGEDVSVTAALAMRHVLESKGCIFLDDSGTTGVAIRK